MRTIWREANLDGAAAMGFFRLAHSGAATVAKYIANQEEHPRNRSFAEEFKLLVERHGLEWRDDKTAEAVPIVSLAAAPPR